MIVDASVFVAIYKGEPEAPVFEAALASEPFAVAAITLTEVGMRVRTYTKSGDRMMAYVRGIAERASSVIPIDAHHAEAANDAFDRYGKGTGHPAGLNFGDCLVYAVAKRRALPLLFKGDDFARTDLDLHPAAQAG